MVPVVLHARSPNTKVLLALFIFISTAFVQTPKPKPDKLDLHMRQSLLMNPEPAGEEPPAPATVPQRRLHPRAMRLVCGFA